MLWMTGFEAEGAPSLSLQRPTVGQFVAVPGPFSSGPELPLTEFDAPTGGDLMAGCLGSDKRPVDRFQS